MIRVVIRYSGDVIDGYTIDGHAGYADKGEDIVCAAVSVLGINTVNALQKIAGETFLMKEEDGCLVVSFEHRPSGQADVLLRAFELGITDIAREYGDEYVVLKKEVLE